MIQRFNCFRDFLGLQVIRYNATKQAAKDQSIAIAERRKGTAHREYEKMLDFHNIGVKVTRDYRVGLELPHSELNCFDIFEPLNELIMSDEEVCLHLMLCKLNNVHNCILIKKSSTFQVLSTNG